MKQRILKFNFPTDKELLDMIIFYLIPLRDVLPYQRLKDHCTGAIASLFELVSYLDSHKIVDYGNNKK